MELKQTQKLSPQMIQSMEVLQMGTQELMDYVERELLDNPALEREESRAEALPDLHRRLEWLADNDRQNRWYHAEEGDDPAARVADSAGESLYDHLRSQLDLRRMDCPTRRAVECVLTGLDERGYLEESTQELAARCGQSLDTVERAEGLVRALEPAGVGARCLSQCLALQLERLGETGLPLTIALHHLEDVAKNRYHRIASLTGASREDIQAACTVIRSLAPRPGAAFAPREAPEYIIPDLLVEEREGRLEVSLNDACVPELKVSAYYQKLMGETDETEVRDYLNDRVNRAVWMVKSIGQRQATLLSCARCVVARQEDFFRRGSAHLRPMTLADVAGDLSVHESTVSRALKDKYLQCGRGVFPMSWFFSRALPSDSGDGASPEGAKAAIRELIDGEDKRKPLSDQKLCDALAEQGMTLSRRTVAKYRDELGIPSGPGRKVF